MNTTANTTFDRLMGALHGLPDVASTKAATVRAVTPIVGTSELYIVQTFRQRDIGDTIFLECVNSEGTIRLALPASVSDAIARQRDTLTARSRSKGARAAAKTRKALGIVPFARKASTSRSRKRAKGSKHAAVKEPAEA